MQRFTGFLNTVESIFLGECRPCRMRGLGIVSPNNARFRSPAPSASPQTTFGHLAVPPIKMLKPLFLPVSPNNAVFRSKFRESWGKRETCVSRESDSDGNRRAIGPQFCARSKRHRSNNVQMFADVKIATDNWQVRKAVLVQRNATDYCCRAGSVAFTRTLLRNLRRSESASSVSFEAEQSAICGRHDGLGPIPRDLTDHHHRVG